MRSVPNALIIASMVSIAASLSAAVETGNNADGARNPAPDFAIQMSVEPLWADPVSRVPPPWSPQDRLMSIPGTMLASLFPEVPATITLPEPVDQTSVWREPVRRKVAGDWSDVVGTVVNSPRISDPSLSASDRCLAQAVYFEARGEAIPGQVAVAQVVMNRVRDARYPDEICGVVFENEHRRHRCQFSFACDGRSDRPRHARAWETAKQVAMLVKYHAVADLVGPSTHYHADYVSPRWSSRLEKVAVIGKHIFYLEMPPRGRLSRNS